MPNLRKIGGVVGLTLTIILVTLSFRGYQHLRLAAAAMQTNDSTTAVLEYGRALRCHFPGTPISRIARLALEDMVASNPLAKAVLKSSTTSVEIGPVEPFWGGWVAVSGWAWVLVGLFSVIASAKQARYRLLGLTVFFWVAWLVGLTQA